MIGLKLAGAKALFFDRAAVANAMDRATKRALSKFGAFVRRRARSSIRSRKRASNPGEPPSSHTGLLKNNIFFVFEPDSKSVVIGPILLNGRAAGGELPVPGLLEHGGDAVRRMFDAKRKRFGEPRRVHYEERPYMGPAFEEELQGAAAAFKDQAK